jgi:hypothetical protein
MKAAIYWFNHPKEAEESTPSQKWVIPFVQYLKSPPMSEMLAHRIGL